MGNHAKVFQDAGVEVGATAPMLTETTLDYEGMKEDLMKAEKGSTILLRARTTRRASTRRQPNGAIYLPH